MANAISTEANCKIVKDRNLNLKADSEDVDFNGVALLNEDTLLVTDFKAMNLQIYNRQDGKRISASDRLESYPRGVCILSDTEIAVCLWDGKIVILSLESIHGVKRVKTINVDRTGFDFKCHSVAKWTPDKLVVSGQTVTGAILCWCVVSVNDENPASTHICEVKGFGYGTHLAVKGDTVYVSCRTPDYINNGVYAFDISNPQKPKFLYQHQELNPGPIMADRDYVYVCDQWYMKTIHQVTDHGQLVVIHKVSSCIRGILYNDQHGVLYTTSDRSNVITVYKMVYPHQAGIPVEILSMDDRSIQLFEDALKDGKETIYSIRIMVVGHLNVGKSTLIRRLLGEEVDISERCSTEGINVYVNCCDVSLSTGKWKRREKDKKQVYDLSRLAKLLENYQKSGRPADQEQDDIPPQIESTDQDLEDGVTFLDEDYETCGGFSDQEQDDIPPQIERTDQDLVDSVTVSDIGQNVSSSTNHKEDSPSTDVQRIQPLHEIDMMPRRETIDNKETESYKKGPLREMLQLLKEDQDKALTHVNNYASLSIWDFAGQYAYYTTHQMFLTRRAIYLLVSDVSAHFNDDVQKCYLDTEGEKKWKNHGLVDIWMNSIHSCAPSDTDNLKSAHSSSMSYTVIPPPVILVGTHIDQILQRQSVITASKKYKQPQIQKAATFASKTISESTLSREPLPLPNNQESLPKSTERLQRNRRATEGVFSASIQKGVTCADSKLLYQVLYNLTPSALSSRSTLEANCHNVGLQFHGETPGNGNCFFEAVSSQLRRVNDPEQRSPQQLRRDAVAFLKANPVLQVSDGSINFAEFLCNESFEEYCARMENNGARADHVLVLAMARALQKDIMIVTSSPSSGSDNNIAWVVGQENFQGQPILLGHIWEHHYESLEPIDSGHKVKRLKRDAEKMEFDENDKQAKKIQTFQEDKLIHSVGDDLANENSLVDSRLKSFKQTIERVASKVPSFREELLTQMSLLMKGLEKDYQREYGQRYLKDIRSYLQGKPTAVHLVDEDFAIDNSIVDSKLDDLKKKIVEVAKQQPYWGVQIPTRWFLLEQQLMGLRNNGSKVISRSKVEQINKEGTVQIKETDELDLFLKYLHETGTIIYFSIAILRDNIILDPEWLIYALKSLINAHDHLPDRSTENRSQSSSSTDQGSQPHIPTDHGSQPHIPTDSNAGNISHHNFSTDTLIKEKWSDFKEKGILTTELVDVLWSKDEHPDLHEHKDLLLRTLEQFNIIAKPRSFSEIGEKVENYYIVPCMLDQKCDREVTDLVHDCHVVSTTDLCCVFKGKYLPPPIFHRLVGACITQFQVAKEKGTSKKLIFSGCCIFDIDQLHRLTLHCRKHIIYARITKMAVDNVWILDARLCTRVKKFITETLTKIIPCLGQNLQYHWQTQYPQYRCTSLDGMHYLPPLFNKWFANEECDPNMAFTPENINHARLIIALGTVCVKAMREVFRTEVLKAYKDVNLALSTNKDKLTKRNKGQKLLNKKQDEVVFQKQGTLEDFDISLLYILIRNITSIQAPLTGWGNPTQDQPQRDTTLGASVERLRNYRNDIGGHSPETVTQHQDFLDYWEKFEDVIHDIESKLGGNITVYSQELKKQRDHVFSVYEIC